MSIRCTAEQLPGLIEKRLAKLFKDIQKQVERTAEDAVPIIKSNAPKAFGDLRGSVHIVTGPTPKVVVDAPHAGAVEQGSAPHVPDIDKLTEWVKLRGMQGLRNLRSLKKHGPTTPEQAARAKAWLKQEVQSGPGGDFSPIDSPRKVAEAIAKGIEKYGTKPHWFVRGSLPLIEIRLGNNIRKALK